MLLRDVYQGRKFSETGVSKNNIDSSLRLDSLVEAIKVGQFSNISLNAGNIAADCLHGLIEFLLTTARDEDVSTFSDEELAAANSIPVVPPVMTATFPCNLPSGCGISFNADIKNLSVRYECTTPADASRKIVHQ